ncbi:MAG: hypothetical protein JWM10_1219 [Myxococcaceae bacterium]|nr:hypothetical protein [Myxococcaceae bacterium]
MRLRAAALAEVGLCALDPHDSAWCSPLAGQPFRRAPALDGFAWLGSPSAHTWILRRDGSVRCVDEQLREARNRWCLPRDARHVVGCLDECAVDHNGHAIEPADGPTAQGDLSPGLAPGSALLPALGGQVRGSTGFAGTECLLGVNGRVACTSGLDAEVRGDVPGRVPTVLDALTNVEEVRASGVFVCARRSDGRVLCWGDNAEGSLTRAAADAAPSSVPFPR